ncbi:MAG: hypothetical protein J2P21_22920 [Chloracidobacterium sp.]|nr:hypothetical protein [Chloracidobacterium sp.]
MNEEKKDRVPEAIEMPAPTAWPMITAFGLALLLTGLVTSLAVSVVGLILATRGAVGWFRDVLPIEKHELIPALPIEHRAQPVKVSPRSVTPLIAGEAGHRVHIPARIHPYTSGIKGGIAGGVAMAFIACAYGLVAYGSVWYPINLLAASALPSMAGADLSRLKAFDPPALILAVVIHGALSILVGLLFAVLLPMLPSRRHAFLGSIFAPLLWSALVWSTLDIVNPTLNARIDWGWFVTSQVAFGLVAGYIVHHSETVETMQSWPLAARAGLRAPGLWRERQPREGGEEQ